MLYGYKARTWVLISTDRSTMGTTLEEIGAPWIYISLSSGQRTEGLPSKKYCINKRKNWNSYCRSYVQLFIRNLDFDHVILL